MIMDFKNDTQITQPSHWPRVPSIPCVILGPHPRMARLEYFFCGLPCVGPLSRPLALYSR